MWRDREKRQYKTQGVERESKSKRHVLSKRSYLSYTSWDWEYSASHGKMTQIQSYPFMPFHLLPLKLS